MKDPTATTFTPPEGIKSEEEEEEEERNHQFLGVKVHKVILNIGL